VVTFLTPLAKNSLTAKGSIGQGFPFRTGTEGANQVSFSPFGRREVSVLTELALGHLRYRVTDVPPQPNSPPDTVSDLDRESRGPKPGGSQGNKGPGIPTERAGREKGRVEEGAPSQS